MYCIKILICCLSLIVKWLAGSIHMGYDKQDICGDMITFKGQNRWKTEHNTVITGSSGMPNFCPKWVDFETHSPLGDQ